MNPGYLEGVKRQAQQRCVLFCAYVCVDIDLCPFLDFAFAANVVVVMTFDVVDVATVVVVVFVVVVDVADFLVVVADVVVNVCCCYCR